MRHKIIHILTFVVVCLISLQAYGQQTTEEIYVKSYGAVNKNSARRHARDMEPIRWEHNIRLGANLPSLLSLRFLNGPFYEDERISYSDPSASGALAEERYYQSPTYYFSGATLEYSHSVKSWFSIGSKATYAMMWSSMRHVLTDKILYRDNNYAVGLIFNMRFDWLRRDVVQLYSSIGIGLAARFAFHDGVISPMYDATYFGIAVGRDIYGFIELGGGISGSARAGLGIRFNTQKR